MSIAYYISHPQVTIDPCVPVPEWGLSDIGRARVIAMRAQPWLDSITRIVSSVEKKAAETANILARHLGLGVDVKEHMHENDRSATGYLAPAEFEKVVDAFFATPMTSVRGWEPAVAAQSRIVAAVEAILVEPVCGAVAIVGHGGVGTLLLCHLIGAAISRAHDQPPTGGGNYFSFDIATRNVRHGWRQIDEIVGG